MKFDRQYEPAILVYRETRAPGRLLLRLGRLHDDGSYTLEETAAIEKSFTFATHILAKDTRGLLARLRKCLQDFSMDASGDLDAVVIDYPALQAALQRDMGGKLATELETLWGAPALEAILALPVLTTREQRRRIARYFSDKDDDLEKQTDGYPKWLPFAIGGFLFLIIIPGVFFFVLQPERFQAAQRAARGVLFEYSENAPDLASNTSRESNSEPSLTPLELAMAAQRAELQEKIRKAKQTLYIAADFGPLDETFSATRTLFLPDEEVAPPSGTTPKAPEAEQSLPQGAGTPILDLDADKADQEQQVPRQDANAGDFAQIEDPENAEQETRNSFALPLPDTPVQEMAAAFGFPLDMAGMRLLHINTFDALPTENGDESPSRGATAAYDIRRGPAVIFEAVPADMQGLAGATDDAVRDICSAMGYPITSVAMRPEISTETESFTLAQDPLSVGSEGPDNQQPLPSGTPETPSADPDGPGAFQEATLSIQAGRSDIAGVVITPDTCARASYTVFTLFEFIPEEPETETEPEANLEADL